MRSFKCSHCKKSFKRKEDLKRHSNEIHTSNRPFKCGHCEMTFDRLPHLKGHEKIHVHQAYKCTHCELSFRNKKDLKVHERVHSGEKPYECWLCGKVLISQARLRHHTEKCVSKLLL